MTKLFSMTLIAIGLSATAQALDCHVVQSIGQETDVRFGQRFDCRVSSANPQKDIHIVRLRGSLSEIGYLHGYLLGHEANQGLVKGLVSFINRELQANKRPTLARGLYECFSDHILQSTSDEFINANAQFVKGMQDRLNELHEAPSVDFDQIRRASVATDSGIVLDGVANALGYGSFSERARAVMMINTCLPNIAGSEIGSVFTFLGNGTSRVRLPRNGCTGFTVPARLNSLGSLIHARNLDGDLIASFTSAPTVFLIDEQGQIAKGQPNEGRGFYKYVAAATAGMTYPGGISGFNEKGIAVSTHEMQSREGRTFSQGTPGNIGPFLQQRILREANSIQEAFTIAQKTDRFGSWSIFISDSKTNESATIEMTGSRVALANLVRDIPRVQTNHFLSPEMQDQFFNYDFNKYLETRARFTVLTEKLTQFTPEHRLGLEEAIDLLANHNDADVANEDLRSFGRTVVKGYSSLSTLALPAIQQIWISAGERYPIPHSTFAGLQVDFGKFIVTPVAGSNEMRTHQYAQLSHWDQSLDAYTRALIAYNDRGDTAGALDLLDQAIALAAQDHRIETSYEFIRARVLLELGDANPQHSVEALAQLQTMLGQTSLMDRYGYLKSIVLIYGIIASDRMQKANLGTPLTEKERFLALDEAERTLKELDSQFHHFDLQAKLDLVDKLYRSRDVTDLPELDWVTIEH